MNTIKKYLLLIISILFLINISYGQCYNNGEIDNKINSLKKNSIDTICYYIYFCSGADYAPDLPDSCTIHQSKYLYWIFNGKTYVQMFDNCFKYNPIIIDSSVFMLTLFKNIKTIKKEIIKPVEHYFKKTAIGTGIGNDCITMFRISTSKEIIEKQIEDFKLITEMVDEKYKNDNFEYNQKTVLKKLKEIIEEETKHFNFIKTN